MGRLDGRVALVTGAADVVTTPEKLGRRALAVQADVADERAVTALVDVTLTRLGRLDVLVNNAGIMDRGLFAEAPVAGWVMP